MAEDQGDLHSIAVDNVGGDLGGDLEIFGAISASGTTTATLFNKSEANRITLKEGTSIGSASQPLGEAIIEVKPQPGQAIRLRAKLTDQDDYFGNDALGDETVSASYETGWRKDVAVLLTGSNARVRVNLSLSPI